MNTGFHFKRSECKNEKKTKKDRVFHFTEAYVKGIRPLHSFFLSYYYVLFCLSLKLNKVPDIFVLPSQAKQNAPLFT